MKLKTKELWAFQQEDVDKLSSQKRALIVNDMGTGKTIEAIALDKVWRGALYNLKTLVICPLSSVESTWYKHFTEQTTLRVLKLNSKDRPAFLAELKKQRHDVYIVHWDVLRLMPELREYTWFHIIADECQRAQNRKTQQTQAFKKIKARSKTALSGTPVTNKPQQYWSILNWLWPEEFRSYWSYFKRYVDAEIVYPQGFHKVVGVKNEKELLAKLEPFYVRHRKKDQCCEHHPQGVMPDLPDKLPIRYIPVDLSPIQRQAYNQMNKDMIAWVGEQQDKPVVAPVVIAKLVRLQQFAIANADLIDDRVHLSEPSSKLDVIMELLNDNADEQFVIFSQFSQAIRLLGRRLAKSEISHALYTGDTSAADRAQIVDGFLGGKIRVFAGTIKTGGVGLDLYTASNVIFIDRSWSPAENLQAEDRLHRAGQKNPVTVIDLVARNTIDSKRLKDIDLKWETIRKMLGDI